MTICYLCGHELIGDPELENDDHVPPKQIYGKRVRRENNPVLKVLPTHKSCNFSFHFDEDYFVHSLVVIASGSYAADSVLEDMGERFQEGRRIGLGVRVLDEFDTNSDGPAGGVVRKSADTKRYHRVLWKIIRGLHFKDFGEHVPENRPFYWKIYEPGNKPPDEMKLLDSQSSQGDYPGVFDYKYYRANRDWSGSVYGMRFWEKVIVIGYFHGLECSCTVCSAIV